MISHCPFSRLLSNNPKYSAFPILGQVAIGTSKMEHSDIFGAYGISVKKKSGTDDLAGLEV